MAFLDEARATEIVDAAIVAFAGRGVAIAADDRNRAIRDAVSAAAGFRNADAARECVVTAIEDALRPSFDRAYG